MSNKEGGITLYGADLTSNMKHLMIGSSGALKKI